MKLYAIYFLSVLLLSCTQTIQQKEAPTASNKPIALQENSFPKLNPLHFWEGKDYSLTFNMVPNNDKSYTLEVDVALQNQAHFISPKDPGDFKGKFEIDISETDQLKMVSELKESPLSVAATESSAYESKKVHWVRQNTTYSQQFKSTTQDYFFVQGIVRFVVEPACTLEEVHFFIKNDKGRLYVEIALC